MLVANGNIERLNHPKLLMQYLDEQVLLQAPKGYARPGYLASRVLLAQLIGKKLSPFAYHQGGKPYLADGSCYFNLSHSQERVLVAIDSSAEVGVDIEQIRERPSWQKVANAVFSMAEVQYLNQLPSAQQLAGFWRLWCAREALVKLHGDSVWQMSNYTLAPRTLLSTQGHVQHLCQHGYSLAVASASRSACQWRLID